MAVIAIVSILAAVAIPGYRRYVERSRTVESLIGISRIYLGAQTYFDRDHADSDGAILPAQYPQTVGATPSGVPGVGNRYEPDHSDWTHPTWQAVNFAMATPHYFQYSFVRIVEEGEPSASIEQQTIPKNLASAKNAQHSLSLPGRHDELSDNALAQRGPRGRNNDDDDDDDDDDDNGRDGERGGDDGRGGDNGRDGERGGDDERGGDNGRDGERGGDNGRDGERGGDDERGGDNGRDGERGGDDERGGDNGRDGDRGGNGGQGGGGGGNGGQGGGGQGGDGGGNGGQGGGGGDDQNSDEAQTSTVGADECSEWGPAWCESGLFNSAPHFGTGTYETPATRLSGEVIGIVVMTSIETRAGHRFLYRVGGVSEDGRLQSAGITRD